MEVKRVKSTRKDKNLNIECANGLVFVLAGLNERTLILELTSPLK